MESKGKDAATYEHGTDSVHPPHLAVRVALHELSLAGLAVGSGENALKKEKKKDKKNPRERWRKNATSESEGPTKMKKSRK